MLNTNLTLKKNEEIKDKINNDLQSRKGDSNMETP